MARILQMNECSRQRPLYRLDGARLKAQGVVNTLQGCIFAVSRMRPR